DRRRPRTGSGLSRALDREDPAADICRAHPRAQHQRGRPRARRWHYRGRARRASTRGRSSGSPEAMTPRLYQTTGLWNDVGELPELLQATLDQQQGFGHVASVLRGRAVERIVITGNGASYHVALAVWLTAIGTSASAPPLVAVPAGILASGGFRWLPGDA